MKILFIVPIYVKTISELKKLYLLGGGGRYPYELAKNLAAKKNDKIEMIFFSDKDSSGILDNINITLVKSFNFFTRYNGLSNPVPISKNFYDKIKNADIVHCYQMRTEASLFAVIYAKYIKKPIVLTDTNFNGVTLSRIIKPENFANAVLAISREDYDTWQAKHKYIIYGGVTKEDFPYKKQKKKYVLYFGRILSHKGVDVLVEAVPDNCELIIAGSASDEEYMQYLRKKSIGKKVTFKANVSDKEMVELYQNASCFVLPATAKDYLGKKWGRPGLYALVVPEAMSCGTPVIVSDVGALPDFIEKGKNINGFVFKDRESKDLQKKIKKIISDKDLLYKLGKNARHLVETKYDWQVIAQNVRKIYSKTLTV